MQTREAHLLIDSHAHLDSERYAGDREAMLGRAWDAGVGAVLSIGIGEGPAEMHQALDLCRQYNGQRDAATSPPLRERRHLSPQHNPSR